MPESSKLVIATDNAPAAIGPYSQAVCFEGLIFASGQIGLDPVTGEMVEGGVEAQTRRCLENLRAVLQEAGSGLDRALKVSVFLDDMADYPAVNEVYGQFFDSSSPPAREAMAVKGLPKGAKVEISLVATRETGVPGRG